MKKIVDIIFYDFLKIFISQKSYYLIWLYCFQYVFYINGKKKILKSKILDFVIPNLVIK